MSLDSGEALWDFFENWRQCSGMATATYAAKFGHGRVDLAFYGTHLPEIYRRPLVEARDGDTPPLLDIRIIDGAETLPLPKLGWQVRDFGLKRRVPGWSKESRSVYLLRSERGVAIADWSRRRAYVWISAHGSIPWWERAAPLRWLFDDLARDSDMATLHAAVVARDRRGVLIAGPGGTGKSTLALACVDLGMDYVSDDYCLLDTRRGATCMALYSTAKMNDLAAQGTAKHIVFLDETSPGALTASAEIVAILLPRFAADLRLEPVSAGLALRQIAPSTFAQSEASGPDLLRQLVKLADAAPAYRFDMPPDTQACARAVLTLIESGSVRFP
jgi:hypothetical protein